MKATSTPDNTQQILSRNLARHLEMLFPAGLFLDMASYAVLPAGKLFRPLLAVASFQDEGPANLATELDHKNDLALLCSFLEIHHAYTLVHDDLPCMDNDDERRGRPSHHKAFGEWQALLTGDALLIASFRLLAKIKHPHALEITRLATWATGARGLILGQYKDLSLEMRVNFKELLSTHLYKTARLIQLSLTLPLILKNAPVRELKKRWRFAASLGILFQLLDDLCELSAPELSEHEDDINPWPHYQQRVLIETQSHLERVLAYKADCGEQTWSVLAQYFGKINEHILAHQINIENHAQVKLVPVMGLLSRLAAL